MIPTDSVPTVIGTTAHGTDGSTLGTVGQIYLDDATGRPEWATVRTGPLGTTESVVPLDRAELTGDGLRLPYDRHLIEGAPPVAAGSRITPEQEDRLREYYAVPGGTAAPGAGTGRGGDYATGLETEPGDTITGGTYATGQAADPAGVTTPRGNFATGMEDEPNDTLTGGTYATGQAQDDDPDAVPRSQGRDGAHR